MAVGGRTVRAARRSRAIASAWEHGYNPRSSIPATDLLIDRWRARAAASRARLACTLGHSYGPDPRERLDVFHAPKARRALIFFHGGYWRAFGKEDFSWIAPAFVAAGVTVVIPSYPLCPSATLTAVMRSARAATQYTLDAVLTPSERTRVVLAGHSAGAHLAVSQLDAAPPAVAAAVAISGLYDLVPLLHAPFLAAMPWTLAKLHACSPLYWLAPSRAEVLLAVGARESDEFQWQSQRLAVAWRNRVRGLQSLKGRQHFTALEAFASARHPLHSAALALVMRR